MKKVCISKKWKFTSPDVNGEKIIDLPHDFLIDLPRNPSSAGGASNGYFDGTTGSYEKYMIFGDDEHYILDIDGAYMCTRIYFNDELLDMHPYGYTPYLVDLSNYVKHGMHNKIELTTENLQPSTRWYSGAGVYRDVFLWTGGAVRIEPWDLYVKTPDLKTVEINTAITADDARCVTLRYEISDAEGNAVCSEEKTINTEKGKQSDVTVITVDSAHPWSVEDPYLYTLKAYIISENETIDTFETAFGIRTISVDAKNGFCLNGKSMKLRGGCIHHDHGALGSAEYPAAVKRKIALLKETGFNALRMAHYPPSVTLLEECDRVGMLIMDEAFDMWNIPKNRLDYSLFFRDWWARDIRCMIMRDRSHPCVVSYSIGNEIPERNGYSKGNEWSEKLASEMRKYDDTRPVTIGMCCYFTRPDPDAPEDYKEWYDGACNEKYAGEQEYWDKMSPAFFAPLDMVGYNYLFSYYDDEVKKHPDRVIWGSETRVESFYDSWGGVMKHPNIIGDFTWTAYDNLGEAGTGRGAWASEGFIPGISQAAYPYRTCFQGDLDLCGYRRPQSYFREAIWLGNTEPRIFTTHPKHFGEAYSGTGWHWFDVHECWTFEDEYIGKPVKAEVYTDADEILFILNGREVGRVKPIRAVAEIAVPYEKGELTAVSFKGGKEQKRYTLRTTGVPHKITVTPETKVFAADNRDLCFLEVAITDFDGNLITDAADELECSVHRGELVAFWSGCPNNEDQYGSNKCHAFGGRALAVVRSKRLCYVDVSVSAKGLSCGSARVTAASPVLLMREDKIPEAPYLG